MLDFKFLGCQHIFVVKSEKFVIFKFHELFQVVDATPTHILDASKACKSPEVLEMAVDYRDCSRGTGPNQSDFSFTSLNYSFCSLLNNFFSETGEYPKVKNGYTSPPK